MDRKNSSKIKREKEQNCLKTEHEPNASVAQTDPDIVKELTGESEGSCSLTNKGKSKGNRKRKTNNLPDEDVIDGFLILSYGCLEDLEADGPIKPGASIAKKSRIGSPTLPGKKSKNKILKSKKGSGDKSKKNKENSAKDVLSEFDEKPKKKYKKQKVENATITKPDQSTITEPGLEEKETKKDVAISPLRVNEMTEDTSPPPPTSSSKSPTPVLLDQKPRIVKSAEKVPTSECIIKPMKEITPKKTLSDFSIRAIQGIDTSSNSDGGTKSIATMTSENGRDKSVSPLEAVPRVPLSSSQYNKLSDKRLSSTPSVNSSTSKHGFPFPDKHGRDSSFAGQFPRVKFTPAVSATGHHRLSLLQDDHSDNRQDRRSVPNVNSDILRQETHQHQHQHIHQHQHQHQHFHPPYGTMPGHPYGPMKGFKGRRCHPENNASCGSVLNEYYGPVSVMPVVTPNTHQGLPLHSLKKTGKWCALHVQIARFIDETQKKIEKLGFHKPDPNPSLTPSNRSGFHAFQAVQPRSHGHQERDIPHHYGSHFHSNLNALAPQHHSIGRSTEKAGLLSLPHETSHHMTPGHRHSAASRGPEIPPFAFGALNRPFERTQDHEPYAERLSPFRPSRPSEIGHVTTPDFGSVGRTGSQSSLFMRRDTEGKLERERQHHISHSFLDREKPTFFRPSNFDTLERSADIRSGGQSLVHGLAGSDYKRIGSPPLSAAVTTTQNLLRTMDLFEKRLIDRPTDHGSFFHKDKSRDMNLFSSRSRMPSITGSAGHSGLLSNLGIGSSRPHFSSS